MLYTLMGYVHAAVAERVRTIRALAEGERGQGTVEYVGLILLVSLLMVGMVAAMKGFNGKQGTELAEPDRRQDQARRSTRSRSSRSVSRLAPMPASPQLRPRPRRPPAGRRSSPDSSTPPTARR